MKKQTLCWRYWRHIRSNKVEGALLLVTIVAFLLLVVAEARAPVLKVIPNGFIRFLTHDGLKSIVSSISASIVAAYGFYFFNTIHPVMTKRGEILEYLDTLLFVVFKALHDNSMAGPTLALSVSVRIAQRYENGLTIEFVESLESVIHRTGDYSGPGLNPYDQIARAAHARLPSLGFATSMANELSLHQGLIWTDIVEILHQVSVVPVNTLVPMSSDIRRQSLLLGATYFLRKWLSSRS